MTRALLAARGRAAVLLLTAAALVGGAFACGSTPPPKPPPKAETSPSEEPDNPDAEAAAWAHDVPDAGAGEGGLLIASGTPLAKGDEEGARQLLAQFVAPGADHVALTRSLRPTTNDYKALFDAATAPKIESGQSKDWASGKAAIKPGPGQTEIKISSASGADLASWSGGAKDFPGGYKKLGKHVLPTVTFFRFKFVEPGKDTGTAYDGLAFVNGHWVIAPKAYKALEGKGGGLDEEPTPEEPAKPAKKPKGKKKKK